MASSHSAALSGQQQYPATIQPLQTLTQSFAAKQQQQNRHTGGSYSSPFSSGPSPLQHLSPSSSLSQQQPQQQPQSSSRSYETSGVVPTTQQQPQPTEAAGADNDVQMQTEDVPSTSVAETPETADAAAATTSAFNTTPSSEKRKRGRPKGSKTKRVGPKGETQEQIHQQEVFMTTEPSTTTTSPSLPHSQPPQAKAALGTDDAADAKQADPFDSEFFPFLVTPLEPASKLVDRNNSRSLEQTQTRSPSRNNRNAAPSTERTANSPSGQDASSSTSASHGHADMLPVYAFYWNVMTLCSDFFQAATELLSTTPSPVLARAFSSLHQPAPLRLLEQTKALCDSLMSDPSSLTNVQLPSDSIPGMASTLPRRRGATDASIPWTADELLASAAAAKIQSLDVVNNVVSGGSHRPSNAGPTASSRQPTNANAKPDPAPASHPSDSLEMATPTAPFMNPLPHHHHHHHQSNQLMNQVGAPSSPLPSEHGPLGPSFMQYPQAQTASPYPPSTSHYFPSQQQTYPGQSQLSALNSYRPPAQQQLLPQTTTPKSSPTSAYPWNTTVGTTPETTVSKPPASAVDNVTVSPATTAQSTSTGATSATMLPSGSSRPSTATYDSHDTSPVIPNYPATELTQSQTAGQLSQSMQVSQPQRKAAHPIAMQMSAAAAGVSPPLVSQGGHSTSYQHPHRNSISLRPNDVGEWTAEEVARLHAIIRNSNMNVGYPNGSGGITPETDWAKVVNAFNNTRARHHILNKAVALNYPVPPYILAAPATPTGAAPGSLATSERPQSRKRRRVEGMLESPLSSTVEMVASVTGAGSAPAPSPVMRSPSGLSLAQIPTAPPPLQGFPSASPQLLHSSYSNSPSMGPPANPQQLQQQAQQQPTQRPVPPPMYNPGPRLPSAAPGAMPVYRVVPAQQHLHQQSGAQPGVNNASPHAPAFLQSPVSIYPSQPMRQSASAGAPTPAIYPSMPFANSSNPNPPGGTALTGPNVAVPNGASGGSVLSPRAPLRSNGESSPHGGSSGSGNGTTTRRAAANAANATSSGPTTHYSHPFVNYSVPAPAPPSYAAASGGHSKSKKNPDKNSQLLPSAPLNANGRKSATGPANGKPTAG